MTLQNYIEKHYRGSYAAFGKVWGIHGNNVGTKAKDGKHYIYKIEGVDTMVIAKKKPLN